MDREIVEIFDMDGKKGIGKIYDKVVFVDDGIYGEKVLVDVYEDKNSYFLGEKIEQIEKSPYEVNSKCPYFPNCGGCSYQNIDYELEKKLKKDQILNQLKRIGKVSIDDINFIGNDENQYNYRNKISLKVDKNGNLSLYDSNYDLINIKGCNICSKNINLLIEEIQKVLTINSIKGYTKDNIDGIKGITLRDLGDIMLIVEFNRRPKNINKYIDIFSSIDADSLYFSYNKKSFGYGRIDYISGKEQLSYNILGKTFKVSPKSFFQVNKYMTEKIYKKAIEYLKIVKGKNVLDLYCGTGTISILIADYVDRVIGIEEVKQAVSDGIINLELNNIKNVSFVNEKVENYLYKLVDKDIDTIIVDPPRRGLDRQSLRQIINSKINNFIYISCNPATFSRDIRFLSKGGYVLKDVSGFDNFSKTNNMECVGLLIRE